MNIKIHVIGKNKDSYISLGIKEYIKKISKYADVSFIEYPECPIYKNSNEETIKQIECNNILKKLKSTDYVVTLDLNKREYDSVEFAKYFNNVLWLSKSNLHFVIGGSLGLSKEMKSRANSAISLSKLTFLHTMTRLILLEQIYRAFKIINNETYHK